MGEASNKMNHNGSHKRVDELRAEIVRQRETLSVELDELRRRRVEAVIQAKRGAKFAGAGIVGILIIGSLMNALRDLMRGEDEPEFVEVAAVNGKIVPVSKAAADDDTRDSIVAAIVSAITSMVVSEVRRYAMDYARKQLRDRLELGRTTLEARLAERHLPAKIDKPNAA